MKLSTIAAVVLALVLLAPLPADAKKPNNDTITVADTVYAGYTTAAATDGPEDRYVLVQCYNPEYVYAAYFELVDGVALVGPLWSTLWPESPATCTATLGYVRSNGQNFKADRWIELAQSGFSVAV